MAVMTTWNSEEYLQCNRCKELKEINQFRTYLYKDQLRYRYECRDCIKTYNAEYHKMILSVPYLAEHAKVRKAKNNASAKRVHKKKRESAEFREAEKRRHKAYRQKINGRYFVEVDPVIPVLREFMDLYGYDSAAEITGYHKDFLARIVNDEYNVIRIDVADTILTKLHGPSSTVLYDGAKRHFIDDHKGKFLGRKVPV